VGNNMLSTPFVIYGGPIADTPAVSHLLAEHLVQLARQRGIKQIQLRETQPREGWTCHKDKLAMVLPLPQDSPTLNQALGSKLRSQVKRARKENPVFNIGGAELLNDFYGVFSQKMRDHGTPVYAQGFFKDIVHTFNDSVHIATVQLGGRCVAVAFLVRYRDTIEIPWAASLREFDTLGMNMFMYHSLLEDAIERGYRFFDFGRSTRGAQTWRFKKQWGAIEQQLYWHSRHTDVTAHSLEKEDEPSQGKLMQLAVAGWKRLPLPVANRLGPVLARQLPW